jgi:alanine dehydrogenase
LVLIVSSSQARSILSMGDCINAVEAAFKEFAQGTATMPTRVSLTMNDKAGWLGVMPAYLAGIGSMTTKIVSVYTQNEAMRGIPNVLATIVLNDPETGRVSAILEGAYITSMRTGAVSGVATKYLAREDSEVIGIFGAGVQARKQLEAVREVRKVRAAIFYDTDKARARGFVAEVSTKWNLNARVANTPSELAQTSDIIVTATTSTTPVFNGHDLKTGTHINAVGAYTPTSREIDDETVSTSRIVVDSIDAALAEAGDLIIPIQHGVIQRQDIQAELGEIITGKKPARISPEERTLFKSVGLGIQDAAVAKLVFTRAQSSGVGTRIDLES